MSMLSSLSAVDVAVDAMGGDGAPAVPVQAAIQAARDGVRVALVGNESIIESKLRKYGGRNISTLRIVHSEQVIRMDEKPSRAVRQKQNSSIRVAARMVAERDARAMLSAGNSGAVMASGLFDIGRIAGVQRPAIAASIPTRKEPTVLVDLGANTDPTPTQLAQFAIMGNAYAKTVLRRSHPRVALLANGSEETKGNELTRATHELLSKTKMDYLGYCEGRDIFEGDIDVIVSDGFTGNILLKTMEGLISTVRDLLERRAKKSMIANASALLMKDILRRVLKDLNYETAGAAPLLGLRRRCLVAHGASTVTALTNAIHAADQMAGTRIVEMIEDDILRHAELGLWPEGRSDEESSET
ncbi:MAG: phosphate acyltransferase PlsX [Myxococcota bacterium]|nr:phosphate acyltransferase PlsX [Myxococcota bacterium]